MTMLTLKHDDNVVLNDTSYELTQTTIQTPLEFEGEPLVTKQRKKSPIKPNVYADLVGQLGELSYKRSEWEQNAYKTSNQQLYAILAQCLDIYQQMKGRYKAQIEQRCRLDMKLRESGIGFNDSTNLATKIIRYVFKMDRKRAFVYSRVILKAHETNQDAMTLPRWIDEQGGVEEIRRNGGKAGTPVLSPAQYKEVAETALEEAAALAAPFKTVGALTATDDGKSNYVVALVRDNGDGTSSIVYGIQANGIVTAALVHAGKQLSVEDRVAAAAQERRTIKAMRASTLSKAA